MFGIHAAIAEKRNVRNQARRGVQLKKGFRDEAFVLCDEE